MRPTLFVSLLLTVGYCSAFAIDFGANFCPPIWPRPKGSPSDMDQPAPVSLGEDPASGCLCREVPGKLVVCFGREICRRFPKDVEVTPTTLRVKATAIEEVRKGDLKRLGHLEVLNIEGNSKLRKIEVGVFHNMSSLKNLSISYSKNLETLEAGVFEGLKSLKQLYLVQNGFTSISAIAWALAPVYLPNIYKLELSENVFGEIQERDLLPMANTTLKEFNLILCQLEYIHPNSLNSFRNISVLRLGENTFSTSVITNLIGSLVKSKVPLRMLNLYGVGFRKAPPKRLLKVIAGSNITTLVLARNQFEAIKDDMFPFMPNLEVLDLREVLALNISKAAFASMPNLKTLLLNGNKLSTIPDGVLLEQLTYLDLSSNSGNAFFPSFINLGVNRFYGMSNLTLLNLSFNRLHSLYNDSFTGLDSLVILGLKNSTIFHIGAGAFSTLSNLKFLNLENNPFGGSYNLTIDMFEGLENLEVLLLGGCSIRSLENDVTLFQHLTSLRHLGLERNYLLTVSPDNFAPLSQLRTIDLSDNSLVAWQTEVLAANAELEEVYAARNKFSYLSAAMLSDFAGLQKLDLTGNPFTCECSIYEIVKNWHKANRNATIFGLLRQNPTFCVFPDSTTNLTIEQYLKSEVYCDFGGWHFLVTLLVPLTFILLVVLISGILVYKYRWHLRYWMFLARLQLVRTGKRRQRTKPPRSETNFAYDAFVSYSNEDRNFVVRLVAMLENFEPFHKLCVYERDFVVGSYICESVLDSVAKSRKTLLVISDSYAKSQWCRWETQVVEHHNLFFENEYGEYVDDSLILIKLGPVCESHLTPTLRYLMKTRIYLEWNADAEKQKVFWEKLRRALARDKKTVDESV